MDHEDCVRVGNLLGEIFWRMETLLDFYGEADYHDSISNLCAALSEERGVTRVLVVSHPVMVPVVPDAGSNRTSLALTTSTGMKVLRGALACAATLKRTGPAITLRQLGNDRARGPPCQPVPGPVVPVPSYTFNPEFLLIRRPPNYARVQPQCALPEFI